jgi:hypothetical protein
MGSVPSSDPNLHALDKRVGDPELGQRLVPVDHCQVLGVEPARHQLPAQSALGDSRVVLPGSSRLPRLTAIRLRWGYFVAWPTTIRSGNA